MKKFNKKYEWVDDALIYSGTKFGIEQNLVQ
jgi:hypothetical protein